MRMDHPSSFALDWVSKRLYWTEFVLGRIMCATLDGTKEYIVVNEKHNYHPISLAIDSLRG